MLTQEQLNHRVREAIKLPGFDAQFGALRVIVRNTPPALLAQCPWYCEWLVENRTRIKELVALKSIEQLRHS